MSRIQKITCDECGHECVISFEIPKKHEIYWMNKEGVITTGTDSKYEGKLVKSNFNPNDVEEIIGDCDDCGNVGATLLLVDKTLIRDDALDSSGLWSLL